MSTKGNEATNVWSTVMPHTDRGDRGEIRRCFNPTVNPEMGLEGCRTMYEGFRYGATLNPLGPCLGFRAISNKGMATPYIYSSYSEVVARVDCFCAGLDTLHLVSPNPDNMKLIGLYLPNCMEWVVAEHAIFSLGGATVPLYDTCM
jgi:long-chain acyl-CoA synthetase